MSSRDTGRCAVTDSHPRFPFGYNCCPSDIAHVNEHSNAIAIRAAAADLLGQTCPLSTILNMPSFGLTKARALQGNLRKAVSVATTSACSLSTSHPGYRRNQRTCHQQSHAVQLAPRLSSRRPIAFLGTLAGSSACNGIKLKVVDEGVSRPFLARAEYSNNTDPFSDRNHKYSSL